MTLCNVAIVNGMSNSLTWQAVTHLGLILCLVDVQLGLLWQGSRGGLAARIK